MQWLTPAGIAFSNGASSRTTNADLPPSSRHTFLMPAPATAATRLPAACEPVKLTMSMAGMRGDRLADDAARSRHDVEHAGGQADLPGRLGEDEGAERRQFGRLEHHRAAGGERRRDLADHLVQRVVPRRDAADHADRLLHDQRVAELLLEPGLAEEPRVGADHRDRELGLHLGGVAERRADFVGDRLRDVGHARLHRRAELLEPRRPLLDGGRAPVAVERARAAVAAASTSAAVPRGTRPMTCSVDDETTSIASPPDGVRQSPSMKSPVVTRSSGELLSGLEASG